MVEQVANSASDGDQAQLDAERQRCASEGQRTGNDGHEQPFKDARQMISDRATRDGDGFA
jgi:hypothetical protein